MKELVYNNENIDKNDIHETVIRTKALLIDSNNNIFIAKTNESYHFPGGHLEGSETLEECLIREIREETGLELDVENRTPFYKITYYTKNYNKTGKNRVNDIYYFIVKINGNIILNNTKLTESEKKNNFKIIKMPVKEAIDYLKNTINKKSEINDIIVRDMIIVLEEYNKM